MPRQRNPKIPPQSGSREDHLAEYTAALGYFLWRKVRVGTQCQYEIYNAHRPFTRLPPHVKGRSPLFTFGSMAELASWLLDRNLEQGVLSVEAQNELFNILGV